MWRAARDGNYAECEKLLNEKADPNLYDKDGWTALMVAAANGSTDICKLLLVHRALTSSQSNKGRTALWLACQAGHVSCSELLAEFEEDIEVADINGCTPLMVATEQEHFEVSRVIVRAGADCSQVCGIDAFLYWAAKNEDIDLCHQLIIAGANFSKKKKGETPLSIILSSDKTNIAEHPLYKTLALYDAASASNYEACQEWIKKGAEINYPDKKGRTPLYFVCKDGNLEMVKLFIEKGAFVESEGCLQASLEFYHTEVAKVLLNHGCAIDQVRE